ncbi:HepT-like ribonuclease domain-containing protein [Alicyclobacillus contaminans]|uniref:HepT-like ribonuclease domain-containing protein n=1 Tax=Alicyclobacillus contaminans TaxID=392016 RepID=UPI0009FBDE4C
MEDILEAIRRIQECTSDGEEAFFRLTMIQDAVIRNFEVIGEAAGKLSLRSRLSRNIPWRQIIAFRNVLIHDYGNVNLEIVWRTVRDELPALKRELEQYITRKT